MDIFNLDDNLTKLQENLVNHIDQEANRILVEITKHLSKLATKFKGYFRLNLKIQKSEINKQFAIVYSEKLDLQTKKKTIINLKNQVEQNVKYMKKIFSATNREEMDAQFSNKKNAVTQNSINNSQQIIIDSNQSVSQQNQNNNKQLICSLCLRQFFNLQSLGKHMKSTHKSAVISTYKCTHCKSLHTNPSELAQHLIQIHGDVGFLDRRKKKFYVDGQSQQIFYEVDDLKDFIQKSNIFSGLNHLDGIDNVDELDISDSELAEILS